MLRISPTRISFALADLDGLDERMQARQAARLSRPRASNARLSSGPARQTHLSFVPAESNASRQRAASSSSDVVTENELAKIRHTSVRASEDVATQVCLQDPSPRRQLSTQSQIWQDPVPQLMLPPSGPSQNTMMDPGAPVFVPRTRFGTTSVGSLASPNLERYPLLRPSTNLPRRRQDNAADRLSAHRPDEYHIRRVWTPQLQPHRLGSASSVDLTLPTGSSTRLHTGSSRSTPNLLLHPAETHSRGSSLSWRHSPGPISFGSSRQSSREGLDAAAEFLRMRNSPLDDLTGRLSRLAAGRPRSVGHSWERLPDKRARASLLTGDPFRQASTQEPDTSHPLSDDDSGPSVTKRIDSGTHHGGDCGEDRVALAMALPPSSPIASSSQGLPSTPRATSTPRSPLAQRSPKKLLSSPPLSIKRKPVPSSAAVHATPRVAVYDDAKPPAMQPQTPADVAGTSRRRQQRADSAAQQSPVNVDTIRRERAPPIPERSPYRNTYPPTPAAAASNTMASASRTGAARSRAQTQTQRSSENDVENDIEGALQGLEEDRRTWLGRRELGDLDATPPREGRFERYLS